MTDFYNTQFSLIKSYNNKIQDSSIKTYLGSIKKICKELFKSNTCNLMYFKDHTSIIDYLENEVKTISTRKNICTSIIIILKANLTSGSKYPFINDDLLTVYSNYHKNLATKQQDFYLDNEKSEKETLNWITQKDINKKIKELEKKLNIDGNGNVNGGVNEFNGTNRQYIDTFQQYLVLQLYTQLPPIRNDYALVKVVHIPDFDPKDPSELTTNYINFTSKTPLQANLLLCNYKTKKSYGTKVIPLPDNLVEIIYKFQVAKKKIYSQDIDTLLINTTNATPMLKNSLTKYLNKIFHPKKVSTTLLRKCYLSEKYPVIHSNRERENDSYIMGHSISTAQGIYTKKLS